MNPEFLGVAERIGARLSRDAWWSRGRCNWTGEFQEGEIAGHGLFGPNLYRGTAGIALFLWRLAEATGERIFRVTALGALRQALSKLPHPGWGFYAGGLGVHFAAWEIRSECDQDALLQQAATDRTRLDVIYGSAGCIPMLLRLHCEHGGARWMEAAVAHGDLLLAEAARSDNGWSWRTWPDAPNLTGYSHGTAGIGLALLELWRATGEARFREGAIEAFRFERASFDTVRQRWPDLRSDPPTQPVVWCHGAGGIGFSRLRAWQTLHDDETLAEARTALAAVQNSLTSEGSFCLCHGLGGNADLLIYASQVLGEGRWLTAAEAAGRMGAERIERKNRPWASGMPSGNEVPGLMLGLAGIGYFYLRLADPARTPTVLLSGHSGIDGDLEAASECHSVSR